MSKLKPLLRTTLDALQLITFFIGVALLALLGIVAIPILIALVALAIASPVILVVWLILEAIRSTT